MLKIDDEKKEVWVVEIKACILNGGLGWTSF
jgi:hypothetical protein